MTNIAFLFPGQGSQAPGMGLDIIHNVPQAKERFQQAKEALGWDIEETVCPEGDSSSLNLTLYSQPAIYTLSCVISELLQEAGIQPALVAGHSAGEYAALTVAKSWDFETGLRVIAERARLMHNTQNKGTMAAVIGLAPKSVESVCTNWKEGIVVVANYNSPRQTVISGEEEAIGKITPKLKEAKARRVLKLSVSGAFHSPLMKEAQQLFIEFMKGIDIRPPLCSWVSNNTAEIEDDPKTIRGQLARQFCEPVRWMDSMHLVTQQCNSAVEAGYGEVLKGLAKACCPELPCNTTGSIEGIEKVKEYYGVSS